MKLAEVKSRGTEIANKLARRHVSSEIIDRVVRLSATQPEGSRLRGIHYTTQRDREPVWTGGFVRKGEFLRKHGAAAWRAIPRSYVVKRGRREYISREAEMDNVWMAR